MAAFLICKEVLFLIEGSVFTNFHVTLCSKIFIS